MASDPHVLTDGSSSSSNKYSNTGFDDNDGFPSIANEFNEEGGEGTRKKKAKSGGFQSMGLTQNVLRGVLRKGYQVPTPIQRKAIPIILEGHDVVAMARTGSGKTAAFLIPMLNKLKAHCTKVGIRGVVLSPTRELALQTFTFAKELAKHTDLRICHLIGGDSLNAQFNQLAHNPDVIIATPGRLVHHLQQIGLTLQRVEYLVFDEADRLFEMGFAMQLQEIIKDMKEQRQTLLFSATLPAALAEFAKAGLNNPALVRLDVEAQLSDALKMAFFTVRPQEKTAMLISTLRDIIPAGQQAVVFVATRHHVEFLQAVLTRAHIETAYVYGAMDLTARKISIGKFRAKRASVLIVTDVAARGIDIPLLDNVINYDFPAKPKLFVHRVGRVARAGRSGMAYSFVAPDEMPYMIDLHLFLGRPLQISQGKELQKDEMAAYYGAIPSGMLDVDLEWVNEQIGASSDLQSAYKSMENATKLYIKTRVVSSPESIKRAKNLGVTPVHPILSGKVDKNMIDRYQLLNGIHNFKPMHTIFEARLAADSTKEAAEVMRAKRAQHGQTISQEAQQRAGRAILQREDESEDYTQDMQEPSVKKQKISYKDEEFFISNTPLNMHAEKGLMINERGISRDAVLDIAPDDRDGLNTKRKITKWDRKKRKFIQEDPNEKKGLGTLKDNRNFYVEWQKRTHGRIQAVGEEESHAPQFNGSHVHTATQHNQQAKRELRDVDSLRKHKEKRGKFEEDKKRGLARKFGKGVGTKKSKKVDTNKRHNNNKNQFAVIPPKKKR